MDGMGANGIDMVMTKKSNLEVVLTEKWACLISPASHFSRSSPTQEDCDLIKISGKNMLRIFFRKWHFSKVVFCHFV